MRLKLDRRWKKATYTIGVLYVDGVRFCETLEDRDRGLKQGDHPNIIRSRKVYGETAIPTGTYGVAMNITSPKYAAVSWYWKLCKGKMPRLVKVPCFEGVLIHPGNTALDTKGCILVGRNTKVGRLTDSKACFQEIYRLMREAADNGEEITIEIV